MWREWVLPRFPRDNVRSSFPLCFCSFCVLFLVLETGFFCMALAVLELTFLDQTDLELKRSLPPYHGDQRHALPPSSVLSLLIEMLLLIILAGCLGEPSTGLLATVYNS